MVSIVWGPQKEHETGLCIRTFWHSFRVLAHICHLGLTEWHSRGGDRSVTWLLEEEADCHRGCLIVHYGLAWGPYDACFVVLGFQHPFHKGKQRMKGCSTRPNLHDHCRITQKCFQQSLEDPRQGWGGLPIRWNVTRQLPKGLDIKKHHSLSSQN